MESLSAEVEKTLQVRSVEVEWAHPSFLKKRLRSGPKTEKDFT